MRRPGFLLIGLAVSALASSAASARAAGEPAKAPAGPIPIENFTKYDEVGAIKISPDGEHLAVMAGKYGRSAIAFIHRTSTKRVGGVRCPDGFEMDDFHWVSNTRLIYTIAERQPGKVRPVPTGEILATDIDGRNQKFLYGYRAGEMSTGTRVRVRKSSYATPEVIATLQDDDQHIVIAEYPWREGVDAWYFNPDAKPDISLLDVYTGNKRTLDHAPLAGATVLVDRDERVRFAMGRNDELDDAVSWKPQPDSDWVAFELPGFREESITPRIFGGDNQSVLFTGVRSGETLSALYRLDLKTKEVIRLHAFENSGISDLVLDFAQKEAVGVFGYADKPLYHWLNANDRAARLYAALYKAFPGQNVHVTSTTNDGRLAMVFVASDVNPGDYYVFDTKTLSADYLQSAMSWIDPRMMRPRESFAMKARDGLELHGYLTRPTGGGPHPLVVLPHGGPHGIRDIWEFDWEAQLLANRGYAVLQLNYRGSGGYGAEFQSAGYRQWGKSMQDDLTDATHWAIEQRIAQPDRICIYGASYGGYAALMGVIREPKLYRCAIGYAGIYDLELMLSSADIPTSRVGRDHLQLALGDDREDLHSRSPVYNASKIEVPALLIHGKADWRADFEQATRMKAALEKSQKQYEWMALRGEGHGVYDEETRRDVYEHILDFLDRNLGRPSVKTQ